MKQKRHTIQELSELTGYSRRTIRYYIQEGLLEPPAGRGRGGYYYDSHLNALSKIRQLQNQGLQLSTISEILKEAVTETLDKVIVRSDERAREGFVAEETGLAEELELTEETADLRFKQSTHELSSRFEQSRHPSKPQYPPGPQAPQPPYPHETPVPSSRQVWIRYPIADGAALHVRRDIDINQRKKIDQIIRLAEAILNTSAKGDQ